MTKLPAQNRFNRGEGTISARVTFMDNELGQLVKPQLTLPPFDNPSGANLTFRALRREGDPQNPQVAAVSPVLFYPLALTVDGKRRKMTSQR